MLNIILKHSNLTSKNTERCKTSSNLASLKTNKYLHYENTGNCFSFADRQIGAFYCTFIDILVVEFHSFKGQSSTVLKVNIK